MRIQFTMSKLDGGAWVDCRVIVSDDGDNGEITMTIDGELYREFAGDMADSLAIMLVREER